MATGDGEELYEHRNDPGEWDEAAEPVTVGPLDSSVVTFRLLRTELARPMAAIKDTGETLPDHIRTAIDRRLPRP